MPDNLRAQAISYHVRSYAIAELRAAVEQHSRAPLFRIQAKLQLDYIDSYLRALNCSKILIEEDYIDGDYLADYAGYYVRCFGAYGRRCVRLHFFSCELNEQLLRDLLKGRPATSFTATLAQQHYLGFMVVKPLPQTMIGRTCLRTYDMIDGRDFPNVRPYHVNLFGIELTVKSLAFQEQDRVAAACASNALWTAFQGTGLLFQHNIPSPFAITRLAVDEQPTEGRNFPAHAGLSDLQMAGAVRGVGLDPLFLNIADNWWLRATTYAYLRAGIPIIWLGWVCSQLPEPVEQDYLTVDTVTPTGGSHGGHAATVVGYRLNHKNPPLPEPDTNTLLRAGRIDKIYLHDDNVGPFARLDVKESDLAVHPEGHARKVFHGWLRCQWPTGSSGRSYITDRVLVPLFTTIRIPFHAILSAILPFDATLETLRQYDKVNIQERIEWDVYLSTSNQYKSECLGSDILNETEREDLLLTALPRYLWVATIYEGEARKVDLLFDSTDIEQGLNLLKIVAYDTTFYDELLAAANVYCVDSAYDQERLRHQGKIWEHLRELSASIATEALEQ